MKKTKNLLFTLLVMGLIATPALKVNAETLDESTESSISAVENSTASAPVQDPAVSDPADTSVDSKDVKDVSTDASTGSTTPAPSAPTTPAAPATPVVEEVVVKDANGSILMNLYSSNLSGYRYVTYKTQKITIQAIDDSGNNFGEAFSKDLTDGTNVINFDVDSKTFTITIEKESLIDGLTHEVRDAVIAKYTDNYSVRKDTDKNSIIVEHFITLDDKVETAIAYRYEYNVDSYKTVDSIMTALEEALKVKAPEAEVSSNDATLSKEAIKKLKDTTNTIKADSWNAEWTINANKLTGNENGLDLRVAIDSSVKVQTREKIEKLLDEKDTRRIIDFYHSGKLPEGTQVKIYAGDKFNTNETLTLYAYNFKTNKLVAVNKDLKVDEDGLVTFTLNNASSFVLLPTVNSAKNVQLLATKYNPQTGVMNVTLYAGIALASLVGIVVLRKQMN